MPYTMCADSENAKIEDFWQFPVMYVEIAFNIDEPSLELSDTAEAAPVHSPI